MAPTESHEEAEKRLWAEYSELMALATKQTGSENLAASRLFTVGALELLKRGHEPMRISDRLFDIIKELWSADP
jgi:hypothetical protein